MAFLLLVFASSLAAENPIVGPTGAARGDIVLLDASRAKAKSYAWTVVPKLPAGRLTILPDGAKCQVCSVRHKIDGFPAGTYYVFCSTADEKGVVTIWEWQVKIAEDDNPGPPQPTPPNPGPNPNPNPQPNPPTPVPPDPPAPKPLPDGRYKLAALIAAEAGKLPAAAKVRAPIMATAFGTLQAKIAAGGIAVWQVPIETLTAFNAAAGDQLAAWQPVSKATQTRLRELAKVAGAGGIKSLADLAEAYGELKVGLEAVK